MDIVIFISGIIIGVGICWLFSYILKKREEEIRKEFNDEMEDVVNTYDEMIIFKDEELAQSNEHIQYMEKVIEILNNEITELYEDDEISNSTKIRTKQIRDKYNIDEILDIISKQGISALSDEQKNFLDNYDKDEDK